LNNWLHRVGLNGRGSVELHYRLFSAYPVHVYTSTGKNPAGILGDAEADPEGLFGAMSWVQRGKVWEGAKPPHRKKSLEIDRLK